MGHLALENRQLHDGLEQCTIDTVEEGNSQGGQTNTKLRVTSERTPSPLETQSSRDSFTSPRTKAWFHIPERDWQASHEFKIWEPNLQYLESVSVFICIGSYRSQTQ